MSAPASPAPTAYAYHHRASTVITSQELGKITLQHLQALAWHYANQAKGTETASVRCIDVHALKIRALRAHLRDHVPDAVHPTPQQLTGMVGAYMRQAKNARMVAAMLAAATSGPRSSRSSASAPTSAAQRQQQQQQPADGKEDEEEEKGPAIDSNDDDDDDGQQDIQALASVSFTPSSSGRQVAKRRQQAAASDVGRDGRSDAKRLAFSRPAGVSFGSSLYPQALTVCLSCGQPCPVLAGQAVPTCSECLQQQLAAFSQLPQHPSATASASPTWSGAATWTHPALSTLVPSSAIRSRDLAQLDAKIIKSAREGKQHYPLADLLRPFAESSTASSSVLDHEHTIVFSTHGGQLAQLTGAAATAARKAPVRRRFISSFLEVVEVFLFSLITPIYDGRPDLAAQTFALLGLAQELARIHNLEIAVQYVNEVRQQFFNAPGGALNRHVYTIDTTYNMGALDQNIWFKVCSPAMGGQQRQQPRAALTGPAASFSSTSGAASNAICRNFNAGRCTRQPCKFLHHCQQCNNPGHTAQQCAASHASAQQGGGRRGTTPAPPNAGQQRGTSSTAPAPAGGLAP